MVVTFFHTGVTLRAFNDINLKENNKSEYLNDILLHRVPAIRT